MSRSLSGESSPEEEAQLAEALQQNPVLQQQYFILKTAWQNSQHEGVTSSTNSQVSRILQLARVQELLPSAEEVYELQQRKRRRRRLYRTFAFAAGILAATITIWYVAGRQQPLQTAEQPKGMQQVVTQNGSRTRTMLPDGTTVWLNAGSKIYYENDLAGATREVKLEGEAYFDVVKNPARPFIVHTGVIDIKVLGTVFNVRSYPAEKVVEATLLRGLIQVTRNGYPKQKPLFIHPNEKLVVDKEVIKTTDEKLQQHPGLPTVDGYKIAQLDTTLKEAERLETAWVYNRLEFRGEDFETLAGKMERWYNVSIVFDDESVKHQTFNGSFEKETVEQAFTALKAVAPFGFTIHGHEIHIKSIK